MLGAQFVLPYGICVLSGLVWDKHITALAIWRFKKHPFSLAERFAFVVAFGVGLDFPTLWGYIGNAYAP